MSEVTLPFRPGTVSRDVLRRPVFLLGGMNALLLQLAEPGVAAGVAEHSDFSNRMFDRLQHTLHLMVYVGLGEPADAGRALRAMDRAHQGVQGSLPDGSGYDADDPELRLWVLATLIGTVLAVEVTYVGEFDEDARRRYYRESRELARAFGVNDAPADLDEFRAYMSHRISRLEVTDVAKGMAESVLHPRLGWGIPPAVFAPLRLLTADLLPTRLREPYGLGLSPAQTWWLRRFQTGSRAALPRLPDWIRTLPVLRPADIARDRTLQFSR